MKHIKKKKNDITYSYAFNYYLQLTFNFFQENTCIAEMVEANCCETQIKEDEVKSVSISRKSIENIKKKFSRIKQAQAMSTIPHSPQSPF